jgi:hypothetical protein
MARFVVTLGDEDRAVLEQYRAHCGLRSEAEAIRSLIELGRGVLSGGEAKRPPLAPPSPGRVLVGFDAVTGEAVYREKGPAVTPVKGKK